MTTKERLTTSANLLERIGSCGSIKNGPGIFSAVEAKIVGRELDELEAEWQASSEVRALVLVRAPYTVRHLSSRTNPGKLGS